MESGKKKILILEIYKILCLYSSRNEPIRQTEIASQLNCSRKTIARNIDYLIACGYPIMKTYYGYIIDEQPSIMNESSSHIEATLQFADAENLYRIMDRVGMVKSIDIETKTAQVDADEKRLIANCLYYPKTIKLLSPQSTIDKLREKLKQAKRSYKQRTKK